MSVFAYTALAKDGQRTSGTLQSESRPAALAQVRGMGLHPVTLEQAPDAAAPKARASGASRTGGRISQRALEAFTRELASLLAGGVPLARALALLGREASGAAAKSLWGRIHDDVVGGTSLADALAKWPRTFSPVYVAMVRAGEAGGFLDVVLMQIADFRTRESELKGRVRAAMVYPAILALLTVGAVTFLMTYFIPQFSSLFEQFGSNLPLLTEIMIAASHALVHWAPVTIAVLVIAGIMFWRALTTASGRRGLEVLMLRTPMLGQVIARFALVRFARMLGTLVGAGVPLISSLKVAREAIGNQTLADTVLHSIEQVQRGTALSKSLASSPVLFPPSVVEMVAVAEETGRLDKELLRLAAAYEADLDRQLRLLVSFAEPAMLFLMAALIGTIVVGMLLPIFSFQEIFH